ncbi:unnamed protein product [Staurois parvus]|uniref:Uncharacterized protein n=1 Tax=Staurois parvus TaxID=386267 RepID=A0ABN9GSD8_9NEOB|nr:unnamed protein product [Staurois parvus]
MLRDTVMGTFILRGTLMDTFYVKGHSDENILVERGTLMGNMM